MYICNIAHKYIQANLLLVDTITGPKFKVSLFVLMKPLGGGLHIKVTQMGQGVLVTCVGQNDMGGTG